MYKSDKKNYSNAKIYESIVLFNTLSKILKFIIFKHLWNIMKACNSISNIQMKVCKHRSTDTTLQLITEKIHIVWSNIRRRVISLLSLNEKSAFNNVIHEKEKSSQTASQICEEFSEKSTHYHHNWWLHDNEM